MSKKTTVNADIKRLKLRLEMVKDDLHELMAELSDVYNKVDLHLVIKDNHYYTDSLVLSQSDDEEVCEDEDD